jgi:hypothetical protein
MSLQPVQTVNMAESATADGESSRRASPAPRNHPPLRVKSARARKYLRPSEVEEMMTAATLRRAATRRRRMPGWQRGPKKGLDTI